MPKLLSQWGEDNLIRFISGLYTKIPQRVVGIGDDCAVLPLDKRRSLLVTTDTLIEDTHFLKNSIPPKALGYKSLAVNLSDISAMGGQAKYIFLNLGLPGRTSTKWIKKFMHGFRELSLQENVVLLGGDTVRSEKMMINVTVVGEIKNKNLKLRSEARVGDAICISAPVGDSAAGLQLLLGKRRVSSRWAKKLVQAHYYPTLSTQEAQWFAESKDVHSMMDLSDGLAVDLPRLLKASKCSANVDLNKIPTSVSLREVTKKYSWDILNLSLAGGEDYGLLFTIDGKKISKLQKTFKKKFKKPFFVIGKVTSKQKQPITYQAIGRPVKKSFTGFTHF